MAWSSIRRWWPWMCLALVLIVSGVWSALPWVYRSDLVIPLTANALARQPGQSVYALATDDGISFWRPEDRQFYPLVGTRSSDGAAYSFRTILAWSADGRYLATDGDAWSRTVEIWDIGTKTLVGTLQESPETHAEALAFSPDGALLAIAAYDELQIWRWREQHIVHTVDIRSGTPVAFSADGQYVITPAGIWSASTGQVIRRSYELESGSGTCVAASLTTMVAAFCGGDGEVTLVNLTTLQIIRQFRAYHGGITAIAFSPDGQWLAVGPGAYEGALVEAFEVRVWDVATGQQHRTFPSPSLGSVVVLAVSNAGQPIALTRTERFFGIYQNQRALHMWAVP